MKTYNEIDIKYYDNDGNIQVRCSVPVTQDALVHYELMQSHYCKLSFKLSKPIYFLLGDFIDTPYGRFELIDLAKAKDNDTIGYSYEIQFDAYYRKFKNKILKYRPNTGSQEATFSLTSTISTHVEVIMKSLSYYAKLDKSYLYDSKFDGEGTDYTYVIDASVDANAAKLITYSNSSMLDAIANIAQTFGCEWWFEGNILHFGTCENTNAITDFRLNDNIVSMSSSQSQSTYANRVYAFGAARNLPSGYKNDADADITKDGVVEKRLMLPNSAECSDKNKQLLAENGFELKNGYIQVSGLREDQYVEGVTTNDDIYPRNLIKTSKVTSYEKDVEDESTPEEGDFIKRTFYRVNSLSIINEDGEKTGDMAFRKSYILSGKNLHIVFQSGSLNGMDFECEFNPDGVEEILKDDDGNPILKEGKEQINPMSQVFEIVANEDYGRFLPDITLHPKDGDTFVLYNWDSTKLGDTLVSSASNELLTDAIKDLKKSMIDPTTYTCTAEANYSYNQGRGNLHGVGDRVNLYNKGYGDSHRSSRVIGYEFCLDIPYDGAKYYVGEKPSYSRLNAMESKIEELVYNGQSYLNGNGGGGKSIYIIKSYDKTAPTDYNVYSAKAIDEQRLNRIKDDTAKGTVTWEKVQKFLQGLAIGESGKHYIDKNGGASLSDVVVDRIHDAASTPSDRVIIGAQGFDLYMGDDGKSHMYLDNIVVRQKFFASSAEIRKISYSGGTTIFSNAGSTLAKVSVIFDADGNCIGYKCYACADDGTTRTMNWWRIGMMALCQTFNVKAGKNEKLQNRYYWRLVVGVGQEILDDGKLYDYVVLSNKEKFLGSESIVPTYANKLVTADGTNMLVFGDYGIEVSAAESMGSMAGILMKLEDKETDEGGNLIANRYFYGYESGIAQDAPAEGDVIVQVGDQICWKSRGNLIKISTSTEDNATDNAPAITMYHNLGALYSTGKKDSAGMEIISPYQWKTCTCVISPEQVKFNANNFMWFTEDPEKPFSPITVFYNIETNGMFRVGSSGRLYGDNVENGTAKVSVCCYKVMGDTKDVLDECWWESSCQDIKIDSPYTGRTDLQTNDAAAQNLPAYFTLDCYTLSVTADGTKHRGDVLLATMDIPVLKDGDKGEKGDKGDKGEQGEQGLRGLQGETGEQGIPGTPGKDGKTTYFHIKYSSEANPTTAAQMTETPNTYIGTYVDFLPNDSTDPNVYTWSRFEGLQGKDGTNGIPGKNGADGRTSYLHIKYSNDGGQTLTANDGETPGSWIGQYTDYEQKDSTNVTKYTWSKIKGEQGDQGEKGAPGVAGVSPVTYTVDFLLQEKKVYIYVHKIQEKTNITHLISKWNDTLTCNVYINGEYLAYKDSDVMSDSYIDLLAFPSAKTIDIILKQKDGDEQLAIGNYTIGSEFEYQIIPEVVIFDTNDEGKLLTPKQSAEIKCYRNGQDVTNNCGFSLTNNHHLNCTPGPGQKKNMVIIQNITNVTVDGITMPAQNGYAQVQITDEHGGLHYAYVKFQVNITKFVAHVYSNNKTLTSQYSEISGKVNDMSGKLDGLPTGNELKEWKSSIIQTAREISLSVSEKSVGRRNLLVGSAFLREDNHYMLLSDTRVEMNTGYQGTNCIRISDDTTDGETRYPGAFWDGSQGGKSVRITKGKKYVISCWYKTNSANGHLSLEALYTDKQTNAERKGAPKYLSAGSLVPKPNQWQLFTTVIDTTDAEYDYIAFNFYEYCSVESGLIEAYICRPMVEEGDTYNGWTLSQNDYDIIGANLIDNSRTLDVGGNVLEAKGQKALVGDAYELTYIGSDDYNTFYRIKGSTFKLNTDYTISFEVRGDAKYMGVYAYYPITNTKFTFYAEPQNGAMTEVTDSGKVDNYVALIQVKELSKQQRVWSHFRFEDRLPELIYFQFPKNSEQTGVTSWSVTITKPKIEVGAVVTEYTERKTDLVDKASLKAAGIVVDSESVTLYGNQVHIKKNKTDANDTVLIDNETGQVSAGLINAYEVVAKGIKTQKLEAQNLNVTGNSRLGIFEIKTSSIDERDQYSIAGDMITYRGSYKLPDGKTDITSIDGLAYLMYKPLFIRQGSPENGRYMRLGNNYTEWDDCGTGNGDSYLFNGASARYVCSGSSNCTYYALPKNLSYNTGYFPVSYIYATKATQNDPAFAINVVKTKDSSDGTRTAIQTNGAIRGVIAPNLRIMNYSGQISSSDCIVIVTKGGITLKLPAGPVVGQTLLIYSKVSSNVYIEYDSSGGYGTGKMYSDGSLQTKIEIGRAGTFTYFIFDGENWCYAYFNGSHRNA